MTEWEIHMNTGLLRTDLETLCMELTSIYHHIDILETEKRMLCGLWEGNAKEVFISSFQLGYEKLMKQAKEVESMIEIFRRALECYETCEKQVCEIINEIRIK